MKKIPPSLVPEILTKAERGATLREICAWLKKEHGVEVGTTGVQRHLQKRRVEREVIAKTVVREHVTRHVTGDLNNLDREKRRLKTLATRTYRRAAESPFGLVGESGTRTRADVYCAVVEQQRKLVDLTLHYSGADLPDNGAAEIAAAERTLASGMAGVAERLAKAGISLQPHLGREGLPQ